MFESRSSASLESPVCLPKANGGYALRLQVLLLGSFAMGSFGLLSYLRNGAAWVVAWGAVALVFAVCRFCLTLYCLWRPGTSTFRARLLITSSVLQSGVYAAGPALAILYGDGFDRMIFMALTMGYLLIILEMFHANGVAFTWEALRAGDLKLWQILHWLIPFFAVEAAAIWRMDIWFVAAPLIVALAFPQLAKRLAEITRNLVAAEARASALHRKLADMSRSDALTGVANRRTFDRTLDHEAAYARRAGTDLSLLLIDIDVFKQLNDTWGHQAGDEALREVAKILSASLDPSGALIARYGGEEFAVVLPNTDRRTAGRVGAHLLAQIWRAALPHPTAPEGVLTVSIGCATSPAEVPLPVKTLIAEADAALYRAKNGGRNRCEGGAEDRPTDDLVEEDRQTEDRQTEHRPAIVRDMIVRDMGAYRAPLDQAFPAAPPSEPVLHFATVPSGRVEDDADERSARRMRIIPTEILLILVLAIVILSSLSWWQFGTSWVFAWVAVVTLTVGLRIIQQRAFLARRPGAFAHPAALAATLVLLSGEIAVGGACTHFFEPLKVRTAFGILELSWADLLIIFAGYKGTYLGPVGAETCRPSQSDILAIALPIIVPAIAAAWVGHLWYVAAMSVMIPTFMALARIVTKASRRLALAHTETLNASARLAALATTDGLTGVGNRRAFDARLTQEASRAAANGGCVSLLLVDIDFFKRLNDTRGHLTGDECLRWVADALCTASERATDHVARYGGEEFAILLPLTGPAGALQIAERARRAVADLRIAHPASPFGRVTISIGCATAWGGFDPADLTRRADAALYGAKHAGRNQVGPPAATGTPANAA